MRILFALMLLLPMVNFAQKPIYIYDTNAETRWASFENPSASKAKGGLENNGAKGRPFKSLKKGDKLTLLDVDGTGIINRIWLTISERDPYTLRSLVINMYWDNNSKPAISVPLGDFFGMGNGQVVKFENALFHNPEGRSFTSYLQMPFKTHARIEVINEGAKDVGSLYYDIDFLKLKSFDKDMMYLHAYWHRNLSTTIAHDFDILPKVNGKGKYLGANVSIITNQVYKNYWWGEGEVKIYLDGDDKNPSLNGTGTEDYIGTGWGQGFYSGLYQGCLQADELNRQWQFYRWHILDPIYFQKDCKVSWQIMGGTQKKNAIELQKNNPSMIIPVTINTENTLTHLYVKGKVTDLEKVKGHDDDWVNHYRSDDISSVVYFYLNNASNEFAPIQDVDIRTNGLLKESTLLK
jgi:hypothetical protein